MRLTDLNINVDEFAEFLKDSAKQFLRIRERGVYSDKDNSDAQITPEHIHEVLFVKHDIPQVTDKIVDYVYFISDGEYVKIGKGHPLERLKGCQTGNARKLQLLFTIPVGRAVWNGNKYYKTPGVPAEKLLHEMFSKYQVIGEWFDILQLIDVKKCREFFGALYTKGPRGAEHYKRIMERRKTNERDPLEENI